MRRSFFITIAMVALLGLQFADCMSAASQDQQNMQCCGSMPCDPSNRTHDCCRFMASPQSPSLLPVSHVILHAPAVFVAALLPSLQVQEFSAAVRTELGPPVNSPPELYTLHSSLLI
jgi:hypothetical protein